MVMLAGWVPRRRRSWCAGHRVRQMADMSADGVLVCDGERVLVVNGAARAMLPAAATAEGAGLSHVLPGWTAARVPAGTGTNTVIETAGGPEEVRLSRGALVHGGRSYTVVTIAGHGSLRHHHAELRRLHDTDALTGLASPARFRAMADEQAAAGEAGGAFGVLIIGLDRFTSVNDSLGHAAGDDLLRRTAARILAVPTGARCVARLGGDQFGLLLEEGDPGRVQDAGSALVDVLARWLQADGQAPGVGASAGFVTAPADGTDAEQLRTGAELALRRAKAEGKGVCRPYRTGQAEETRSRHRMELALRRATADERLEVHFQPQSDLRTGRFDGAEALLRWRYPGRDYLQPLDFLPLAEETGLIDEIGEWVLRTACAVASGWPEHLRVAVNLSALQLRKPNLAQTVRRVLADTRLAPRRLELEVTESVLMGDGDRALVTLRQLRADGVRIALDDFGTGYSSLSYLRRFPFDKIKLDRSFIRNAPDDKGDAAIVTAILDLGRSLGVATTAEGLETERQLAFVVAHGCSQGQGYLIGRPGPAAGLPCEFRGASAAP